MTLVIYFVSNYLIVVSFSLTYYSFVHSFIQSLIKGVKGALVLNFFVVEISFARVSSSFCITQLLLNVVWGPHRCGV